MNLSKLKQKKVDYLAHIRNESGTTNDGELLSNVILGGQDGLVNTLGVILGIAAASSDFRIIVAGGMAGAIAEAVSMAAVGYTSKIAERDYYISQLAKEEREIEETPHAEMQEIREIYEKKGFKGDLLEQVLEVLTADRKVWLQTMMEQELKLHPVDDARPLKNSMIIGVAAFFGSLIPLVPFIIFFLSAWNFAGGVRLAMYIALVLSALTLFGVGVVKSHMTVGKWYRSGFQMAAIGTISALFGYVVGWMFS